MHKPWLKHYPAEVPVTSEYPRMNLAKFLLQTTARHPDHAALYFLGKTMTYRELLDASFRFANALRRIGITRGERVAIMLPNCPQAVIAYYGALMIGAVVVQTNPLYMERELLHQLKDSGAVSIVTLDILFRRVAQVRDQTDLQTIIVTSIQDYLPFPKNLLYPVAARKDGMDRTVTYGSGVLNMQEMMACACPAPILCEIDAERDLALLQYTGGTTGLAKGCMLTHYNLIANTMQSKLWQYRNVDGHEKYLAALPFIHVFGMTVLMNLSIAAAGTLYLVPKFQITEILRLIDAHKITVFPGAPTMYVALIHHPQRSKYDLSSIKVCISGAAPLPGEVQTQFERLTGGRLIEGYGLTEASPVTHANNIWEKRKLGSIGIPFPDTDAKIVDPESGEELPPGEIGELVVKGPQVMAGYWNRPEETAQALRGGWLYTGDMAKMDEDGFFYILDRKKDMIIAGGFNIYPREVEEVLYEHPAVQDAVVVGIPDAYRGETVKAYIVCKSDAAVSAEELDAWCRTRLASFKVPRQYEFRKELPKSIIGKVLRRKLLEEEMGKAKHAQGGNHEPRG
ncbi:long-chain-fatty-acid--CoA ligase [Insulibacter thermoxylanivorax]|uniref:Long-chain-fatty-acid--CoA ligase n=1 Tax=Insulibacter thermoxylanivorax TaxID=2749268 RepID=A0A916VE08_9BACL|nr:AMP-binding protein [Insulibacter thermoxylanivorax]GFR36742.1 long-chain-fatty-acid--CoA ligase [Insulibacter thermoxylanivorax]